MRSAAVVLSFSVLAGLVACKQPANSTGSTSPVGGSVATGGGKAGNGGTTSGGSQAAGGSVGVGGSQATGGTARGGSSSVGGVPSTGGVPATGAVPASGGNRLMGGSSSTGGNPANGGAPSTGGIAVTGGTANSGGAVGGAAAVGGSFPTGGASATGGSTLTGGTTAVDAGASSPYLGFQPVPNSQNTANFNPATWYTSWKSKFYVDCGGGLARVANGQGSGNTVSEGIGYGMLLAVGNGDKTALAALWAYYKAHVDANGLMNWSINGCSATTPGQNDNYAATDGDEDTAMALVQADAKWGGYKTDATNLINLIKKYETATGTPSYLRPGDAANNGGKGDGIVNPSYFATGYWHVWATYVGDSLWNQLATDAYTMLAAFQTLTISNSTGALVPDWGNTSGAEPLWQQLLLRCLPDAVASCGGLRLVRDAGCPDISPTCVELCRQTRGRSQCPLRQEQCLLGSVCAVRHSGEPDHGRHVSQRLAIRQYGRHALLPGLAARDIPAPGQSPLSQRCI